MNERERVVRIDSLTERVGERTLVAILLALCAVLLLGGVLALVTDDDALPAAGARVRLDGVGSFTGPDGDTAALRDGTVLHPGDVVEMQEGVAVLELADGGSVEVRSGLADVDDTRIEIGSPLHLLAGDALAQGPAGVAIEAAGTLVTLRDPAGSAARIRRELAVTTATYDGAVELDSAGRTRTVPAYRELAVASVGRITDPDPLVIEVTDPWDQRFLGGAIALTSSLTNLSRAFTAQGVLRTTADDYAEVLPILEEQVGFTTALLDEARPDGETLVGGAIAALAGGRDFDERWEDVFAFRDAGASWGLVALDQGVDDGPVLREVEAALTRSAAPTSEVAVPPTVPVTPTTTPAPTTGTSVPTTSGTTAPPATPTTPTTPVPTTPPVVPTLPTIPPITPEDPVPETGNGLLDGLLQPVGELLGGLLGG